MVLAVIPARGGSKGIPRKNVRLMHGKPLIYYSIQNALACSYIDDVVVSSDDEEILSIAAMYGAKAMNRNIALPAAEKSWLHRPIPHEPHASLTCSRHDSNQRARYI